MGYTTTFTGVITITPALNETEKNQADYWRFCNDKIDDAPRSYCQWEVTHNGDELEWDGGEKFYYPVEWMQWLIDQFPEHQFSGELIAQGEEAGDAWKLVVKGNKAERKEILTTSATLKLPMAANDAGAATVGDYLKALLRRLWIEEESFSGKRPFGNSGWKHELYEPLAKAGRVDAEMDEDGDVCLTREGKQQANKIIHDAIDSLIFGGE